jgi:hypothetical protein
MKGREKALSEFHKRQAQEKQSEREKQMRLDLAEEERILRQKELEDTHFRSFAEKCTQDWADNGKSIFPMIRMLKTMKA